MSGKNTKNAKTSENTWFRTGKEPKTPENMPNTKHSYGCHAPVITTGCADAVSRAVFEPQLKFIFLGHFPETR